MTVIEPPTVDEPKRNAEASGPRRAKRAPIADRKAREVLRKADPVLARLIDARPDFRPRAWMDELPPLDAFGTLIFQVVGQQLSVSATRAILSRVEGHLGGHLPYRQSFSPRIRTCCERAGCRPGRKRRCERSRSGSSTDASATRRSRE